MTGPTAKLLNTFPFVKKITWATGCNLETGPPNTPIEEGRRVTRLDDPEGKRAGCFSANPSSVAEPAADVTCSPNRPLRARQRMVNGHLEQPVAYKKGAAYLGAGFTIKAIHDDYTSAFARQSTGLRQIVTGKETKNYARSGVASDHRRRDFYGTPEGYLKGC